MPLSYVDGAPIFTRDLNPQTQDRLTSLDDDYAQRRFALVWSGVEDAIADRLLAQEATRRNQSYETFVHQEIDSRVGAPSEEEIKGLYTQNQAVIGVSYAQAAPILRKQYQADRTQALRRALTDRLRAQSLVQYNLTPPALDRTALRALGPSQGPAQAQVTVVVYSDFTCPYSAQARRLVKRLTQLYPNQIRIVHQDFPLSSHALAQTAAEAAHCAREQNKFWAYYDAVFDNPTTLKEGDINKSAGQAELDIAAFNRCMATDRPKVAVMQSRADALLVGVKGTPTLFVNGMRLSGVLPLPLMQAFVERELGLDTSAS